MSPKRVERDTLRIPKVRVQEEPGDRRQSRTDVWPPVPDLFDVITFFRSRGDSFTLIASIGFWIGDESGQGAHCAGLEALV
jgi:hypothetical protein